MMKNIRFKMATLMIGVAASAMVLQGCETYKNTSKTVKGGGIGAIVGGAVGALIGKKAGNTAVGAIIGGAVGGTAGSFIGRRMDRQAEALKNSIPDAEVSREGEGILLKFDGGILFGFNSSDLTSTAQGSVDKLAQSLNEYPGTNIEIVGHTDNVGKADYNQKLSERRANAVKSFLVSKGVSGTRLHTVGKGMLEPIADNTTEAGRAQNRRVEIVIVANDELKKEAEASTK